MFLLFSSLLVFSSVEAQEMLVLDAAADQAVTTQIVASSSAFSKEDVANGALKLKELFADGVQLKDFGFVIFSAQEFFSNRTMSVEDQRAFLIQVVDQWIDITDTPYLPDHITDPIFKFLVPPMVHLAIYDESFPSTAKEEDPTEQALMACANQIVADFQDGFQWTDIATIGYRSVWFASGYKNLTLVQKQDVAKQVFDLVIDKTDFPRHIILDPLFKRALHPLIDFVFSKLEAKAALVK